METTNEMMLPDFAPELVAARQEYLRSLGRPAVRTDRPEGQRAHRLPVVSLGRVPRGLLGWLRPLPARPIQGTT